MYARLVVLLSLVVLCLCVQSDRDLYQDFLNKYKKTYSDARFEIFKDNLRIIEQENAKNSGVTLGATKFADLTNDEFRALKKGYFVKSTLPNMDSVAFKALPATFNWVNQGVVGPVQEEGQCGSSIPYTVVDSISSIYAISQNISFSPLSVAQVIDCTSNGCSGSDSDEILQYIEETGLEFNYKNGSCPKGRVTSGVCIKSSACVAQGNEASLAAALVAQGPLFIGIDAGLNSFQLYSSGIYSDPACSSTQLDSSLLLVGYNEQGWLCQNRWGEDWGMNGYIWIARNKNNMCGVATAACYPTGVAKC